VKTHLIIHNYFLYPLVSHQIETYDALACSHPLIYTSQSTFESAILDLVTQIFNPILPGVKSRAISINGTLGMIKVWNIDTVLRGNGVITTPTYTITFYYSDDYVMYNKIQTSNQQINSDDHVPTSSLVYSMNQDLIKWSHTHITDITNTISLTSTETLYPFTKDYSNYDLILFLMSYGSTNRIRDTKIMNIGWVTWGFNITMDGFDPQSGTTIRVSISNGNNGIRACHYSGPYSDNVYLSVYGIKCLIG